MTSEKKYSVLWVIILILNLALAGFIYIYTQNSYAANAYGLMSNIPVLILVVLTVTPVLISKMNSKWGSWLGHGIPLVMILPILWGIYDMSTCHGKLCQLNGLFAIIIAATVAMFFSLFYWFGRIAKKQPGEKLQKSVWIEAVVIAALYFGWILFTIGGNILFSLFR